MSIAWIFPGQGSQKLGMANDVISLPGAIERFELASKIIGRDLFKITCAIDPEIPQPNDLNDTRNTQPAMFVVESLLIDELLRQGRMPSVVAGHSLGEIVALYAAKVFDITKALALLKTRSELMAAAAEGSMTAIMGFDRDELNSLLKGSKGVVVANDNSSSQVVLSGSSEPLRTLVEELKCKRAIPLNVSGAFHSPFMQEPAQAFAKELDDIDFEHATIPVISNCDPTPTCDPLLLKQRLKQQMVSGVRWRETMDAFVHAGINTVLEIGPGKVLSGLVKRSMAGVNVDNISTVDDLK